ncbi:MAG: hypothetical protein ACI8YD_001953, partial [Rheinheimera aquimaris]
AAADEFFVSVANCLHNLPCFGRETGVLTLYHCRLAAFGAGHLAAQISFMSYLFLWFLCLSSHRLRGKITT